MASHRPDAAALTTHRTVSFLHSELKANQFGLATAVRKRRAAEVNEAVIRHRVHGLVARIRREVARNPHLFP